MPGFQILAEYVRIHRSPRLCIAGFDAYISPPERSKYIDIAYRRLLISSVIDASVHWSKCLLLDITPNRPSEHSTGKHDVNKQKQEETSKNSMNLFTHNIIMTTVPALIVVFFEYSMTSCPVTTCLIVRHKLTPCNALCYGIMQVSNSPCYSLTKTWMSRYPNEVQ